MHKRRLRAPSATFAISLIALFVALGGTAYASGLISGKQIRNHTIAKKKLTTAAIKSLRGQRGPQGPQGLKGATGPTGLQGVQGPAGPITGTLPAGVTLRGFFDLANADATVPNEPQRDAISFGLQLASAPTVHVIQPGAAVPAGCTGDASNPGAASGNFCIFVSSKIGTVQEENPLLGGTNSATTFGGVIAVYSPSAGSYYAFGTWAVTG
jgi:hypothetical protein